MFCSFFFIHSFFAPQEQFCSRFCRSALFFFSSSQTVCVCGESVKLKFDVVRRLFSPFFRWSQQRMRTKVVSFSCFFQIFQTKNWRNYDQRWQRASRWGPALARPLQVKIAVWLIFTFSRKNRCEILRKIKLAPRIRAYSGGAPSNFLDGRSWSRRQGKLAVCFGHSFIILPLSREKLWSMRLKMARCQAIQGNLPLRSVEVTRSETRFGLFGKPASSKSVFRTVVKLHESSSYGTNQKDWPLFLNWRHFGLRWRISLILIWPESSTQGCSPFVDGVSCIWIKQKNHRLAVWLQRLQPVANQLPALRVQLLAGSNGHNRHFDRPSLVGSDCRGVCSRKMEPYVSWAGYFRGVIPWLQHTAVKPKGFAYTGVISPVIVKVTLSSVWWRQNPG